MSRSLRISQYSVTPHPRDTPAAVPTPCGLPLGTDTHEIKHSRGASFSWTCSCGSGGRAESIANAEWQLADHLASVLPSEMQAAYRHALENLK